MTQGRAWWLLALLVGCVDAEVSVGGPGLDVTMDDDEPPLDVPGEDIPVNGELPTCPPGWTMVFIARVATCVPPSDPPGVPGPDEEPGGGSGGPGWTPPPPPDPQLDEDAAAERASARYRARMRQRNNACIGSCVAEAVAPEVECRTNDGFTRPAGQACPFGARLEDPDFCPGFFELCVFNRVRPIGGPPDVDVCFDAEGNFVRDAPGCQAEVQSCIASWEQHFNPFDWAPCIQDQDSALACAQACFDAFPVDGEACFGTTDGTSIEGTMDGTRCMGGSGQFVECADLGQTTCSY